ncbi:Dephospho-CoA kinase [hydrothermal vent metagenome]|uniref:Dephospho-CoA kinase n=1 Tax=hydrothermal vent metagenome TaxID=652676 RepID=A0A3B1A4U5_9ZZZZ
MLIIGLTGGIACGKTQVSRYFENLGIPVIDTDIISRNLVEPNSPALTEIIDIFGDDIIDQNKNLKRHRLREIIFNSTERRQQLEAILHPKIHAAVLQQLTSLTQKNKANPNKVPYTVIVIPLLLETKSNYPIDRILLVDCAEQQQIERTMLRDNISREQSLAIIANQISRTERISKVDDVIENNSDLDFCYSQIKNYHEKYLILSQSNRYKFK